jgi:hypothetical protein
MDTTQTLKTIQRQRESLKQQLAEVRRASLLATSKGDYRKVAQLTVETARINQALVASQTQEDMM